MLWDLIQQFQIHDERKRAASLGQKTASLEQRVSELEGELAETRTTVRLLLERLGTHFGEDIDKNGKVG